MSVTSTEEQPTRPPRAARPPSLHILGGAEVRRCIAADRPGCLRVVEDGYRAHDRGRTVNPHSSFLKFPHAPRNRIIALPAHLDDEQPTSGLKWIASFPANIDAGLPRASAVLVLNDQQTGYATTIMEASNVSAARTAASAVLAAELLLGARSASCVGIVGAGPIAREVLDFLRDVGWGVERFALFDLDRTRAGRLGELAAGDFPDADVVVEDTIADTIRASDLVVFATVAGAPHVHDPRLFDHHPVVLHLSLRDLAPEIILDSQNFTDDIGHAVRESTSLELAARLTLGADWEVHPDPVAARQRLGFVTGTIGDLIEGRVARDPEATTIFSPFGLGVLDVAVGRWVSQSVADDATQVTGFYETPVEGHPS